MKHPVARLLLLLVSLLMLGPAPASAEVDKPFGRLFPVGGHWLHLHCTGGGAPTVVLEAGIGGNHPDWIRVQPLVAKATTMCSYDRAGYGWSERGPKPRTAGRIADELHALLSAGKVAPPYLLVSHSFGGLIARLFAARWPAQTAGPILVDAMTPEQYEVSAAAGNILDERDGSERS